MEAKKHISYGINDIEILISTMNRKSLDFLRKMFIIEIILFLYYLFALWITTGALWNC